MSASSNAIWRGVQFVLRAIGLARPVTVGKATSTALLAPGSEPLKLYATIEIIDSPEPPDGGCPAALPVPVLAQTAAVATLYNPAAARPLASQMAFTASRMVPKGRRSAGSGKKVPAPVLSSAFPRKASVIKAKPVRAVTKVKKAPKRRHVWLSNQSRVIRPITSNIVQLSVPSRNQRAAVKPAAQRTVRHLKLAA